MALYLYKGEVAGWVGDEEDDDVDTIGLGGT
jgi:hypothetical protein